MRVVLQNVLSSSVSIDGKIISSINKGFLLLVGFTHTDNELIVDKMVNKIVGLRVFMDEFGKTNLSLKDVGGEILSVSQFTLYGNVKEGKRPSFVNAMRPENATKLYDYFNLKLKETGLNIQTGIFGADMKVNLINDGPFTLIIDSRELWDLWK